MTFDFFDFSTLICFSFYRFLTDVLNTTMSTLVNDTSRTMTKNVRIFYLVIILSVIILLGAIGAFVVWKINNTIDIIRKRNQGYFSFAGCCSDK